MKCPNCQHPESTVTDSRMRKTGETIRRRRECLSCRIRWTTYERIVRDRYQKLDYSSDY